MDAAIFPKLTIVLLFALLAVRAPSHAAGDFIISYWWGPPVTEDLDRRYAEIAECNFTHASFPGGGYATVEQNKAILDACEKYGLKCLIHDPRILKFTPDNPQFGSNLDRVVSDFAAHPAMAGYHVADEPGMGAFPMLGAVNKHLLEKDPQHLPWINLLPNHAPESALGGTYEEHVEKFLTTVKPRLLCFDHYGLMNDGTERPTYFENLEIIRRQGLKHATPFGFIFLVTPHGPFRDTNEADLRWQINTALAYGAKALFYFTYWTPAPDGANTFRNGIIEQDGKRTPHFDMARRINAEIKSWAPVLMKLTSTGIYHTGTIPKGCEALAQDLGLQVNGDVSLVLGTFKHEDGSQWLMAVNRDLRREMTAGVHLGNGLKRVEELSSRDGRLLPVELTNGAIALQLPAAGARLWKLRK